MKRFLALAMIALLAVPAGATLGGPDALPQSGPGDATSDRSTARNGSVDDVTSVNRTRLELSGDSRYNVTRLSFDLGAAVAIDDGTLAAEYQARVDHQRVSNADGGDRLIERFAERIESELDALRVRERTAAETYVSGAMSDRAFARRLVLVSSEANQLREQLSSLGEATDRRETMLRLDSLEFRPRSFTGQAHEQLERGLHGENASPVAITATRNGYALQLLDRSKGTYYRQAIRFDNRNPDGETTVRTTDQAFDRLRALYPETTTDEVFIPSVQRAREAGLYEVRINYPEGSATLYLDAATSSVFYEVQRLDIEAMPRSTAVNESVDGIRVVVERTADGGPTLVKTFDADTGAPVEVTLEVDGREVGRTNPEGQRWFLAPPGTYELSIGEGDARVNVTVSGSGS
jgi:hypothetical protein